MLGRKAHSRCSEFLNRSECMNLLSLSEKTKWPPLIILVPLKIKNLQVNEGHKIPGVRGFRKARYFPLVSEDLKRFDIRSI
jgi:hypothetical protein